MALVAAVALLVARIVTLVVADSRTSSAGWATLAVCIGLVLGAGAALLNETGRFRNLRGRGLGALFLVVGLALTSLVIVTVNRATPELGLDLQGGFSVVLTAQGDPPSDNIDQAITIIRQRIDGLGVAEPEVTRQGDNVVVELPGVDDREQAQEIVGQTAKLEFRPVLVPGLPYDQAAADAGEDPCAEAAAALAEQQGAAGGAVPEEGATDTTVPGTTAPATTAPATTAPPTTGESEGAPARPVPPVGGVTDGESAAPDLGRQEPDGSTTTAPAEPDGSTTTAPAEGATTTTAPADGATTTTAPVADGAADAAGGPAEDTVILPSREAEGQPRSCVQLGPVGFEGDALSSAQAQLGGTSGSDWVVGVNVKGGERDEANALFNACSTGGPTCPGQPGQAAIVLDDEVVSAPAVQDQNLADEEFVISGGGEGGFSEGEAKDLALVLRYGALPVEFTRSAERQVSPTLGEESLDAGILAGVIGLVAVALYLLLYYRALGLVVVAGLAVWGALMYGVICWLSATQGLTLSLAGVVGIVVSIGTTVDSYVVHFERLKDEVKLGKTVRSSTEKGFARAFRTILTADIASFIGAALLWWLTVGAVRGFAFFLGLSVVLDVLVAYCFDRPMVGLLARNRFFTENRIFGVARGLGRSDDAATPAEAGATT
ncbi:protein translocase subunit SecD [Iamia majanohamensis]|uniref:Protein translocase subunit SecD n=1 Tax=Iamia majanohamensis TaxID=467976 RepID=A0AAE9YD30_9ACTN|nr:protein translocase subunit SecD [Iamia majanohamensis]WCO68988.1 protein translocase subunit SecD [Iamia majanohamensis]